MPKKKKKNKKDNSIEKYKKYEDYKKTFMTIKSSLNSIIKNKLITNKINEAIFNVNKIVIHAYQFLKLYCLKMFNEVGSLPKIDTKLVNTIMKVLCKEDSRGRKPNKETVILKEKLKCFYDNHYSKLLDDDLNLYYTNLNTVLDYEAIGMVTNIENHIKNNFYQFFNRYINVLVNKRRKEEKIKEMNISKEQKKELLKKYRSSLRKFKTDVLDNTDKSSLKYIKIKKKIQKKYFDFVDLNRTIISQVNENPIDFLLPLIKMSIFIEKQGEDNNSKKYNDNIFDVLNNKNTINQTKIKTFCCFPLRKSIIPKYIRLDTTTIIHLLFSKNMKKGFYLKDGNTILFRDYIWSLFFRTERKMFKNKHYVFNNQIMTDGIGCSILLINKKRHKELKRNKIPTMKKPFGYQEDRYIDSINNEEQNLYKNYSIVGIDPGKSDLIFATNGKTSIIDKNGRKKHKTNVFRYSQNQRRKETKMKKYRKIIEKYKIDNKINGKSIKEIESYLSKIDSKSNDYFTTQMYIILKSKINNILEKHYQNNLYRKLKWNSFINKQRSDSKMIRNFQRKFGSPNNTLICIGDWSQKSQLKYGEPTKGISMRRLFRKNGYKTFLVDEYNTSKMNHFTGEEMEKFRKRKNVRPWKNDIKKMHGLLRSKNILKNKSCNNVQGKHILLNRDLNGSLNIRQKAVCSLHNLELPKYLKRTKN